MQDKLYGITSAHIEQMLSDLRSGKLKTIVAMDSETTGVTALFTLSDGLVDKILKQELAAALGRERSSHRQQINSTLWAIHYGNTDKISVDPFLECCRRIEAVDKH